MQLRTTSVLTYLALLSSAAYSSQPLAFTTTTNNNAPALSTRIRKRVLARTFLRAMPTDQSTSEFTRRHRPRSSTKTTNSGISTPTPTTTSSSTLSMIVDSQKEFEINLGRAVDTLKSDYPKLLSENPSWNIYHSDLEVIDPMGVSLHGLEDYKVAFGFIHNVVKWFYHEEKSGLTGIRVAYDWARKCIRVSWNVELVPKMIYGGTRHTLHVDGISEYHLDRASGLITEHKFTHLLINDVPVQPERGIFHALAEISPVDPEGVPVFFGADTTARERQLWEDLTSVKFRTWNPLSARGSTTSLFANPNEQAMSLPNQSSSSSLDTASLSYDRDAYEKKNVSRKRFGLPPMTPEDFIKVDEEIRAMGVENKKKATYLAEQLSQQRSKNKKEDGFLSKIFGGALKNGCESNFDCERPQVCCDVGFKKICCANGLGIVDGRPVESYERGLLRVPLPNDNIDY